MIIYTLFLLWKVDKDQGVQPAYSTVFTWLHSRQMIYESMNPLKKKGAKQSPPMRERQAQKIHAMLPPFFAIML